MAISQQNTAVFSHLFSSRQIENVNIYTLTSHECVIFEQLFLAFSFWTENYTNVIVKFVQLIIISVNEKILTDDFCSSI